MNSLFSHPKIHYTVQYLSLIDTNIGTHVNIIDSFACPPEISNKLQYRTSLYKNFSDWIIKAKNGTHTLLIPHSQIAIEEIISKLGLYTHKFPHKNPSNIHVIAIQKNIAKMIFAPLENLYLTGNINQPFQKNNNSKNHHIEPLFPYINSEIMRLITILVLIQEYSEFTESLLTQKLCCSKSSTDNTIECIKEKNPSLIHAKRHVGSITNRRNFSYLSVSTAIQYAFSSNKPTDIVTQYILSHLENISLADLSTINIP